MQTRTCFLEVLTDASKRFVALARLALGTSHFHEDMVPLVIHHRPTRVRL